MSEPRKSTRRKPPPTAPATGPTGPRLEVRKTYKMYIGGQFPRTESGRTYAIESADGRLLAHACLGSRKDVRDAVKAARGAQEGWASRTAYNRAQILYRVAEVMEGRSAQLVDELALGGSADPVGEVSASIDRWVWYAGWADKFATVLGAANPVAGPYFNFSVPEPMGVVGICCPDEAPLGALVARVAPAVVSGNTAVVLASERWPLVSITLAEALATSDLPGGVVNILTGRRSEMLPWLAAHGDVDAVDLSGADGDLVAEAQIAAAEHVARIVGARGVQRDWLTDRAQDLDCIADLCELKTVWHPVGR